MSRSAGAKRPLAGAVHAALILTLSACGHFVARSDRLTYDDDSGWSREVRETARESYRYAQLALNSYNRADSLEQPDSVQLVGRPEKPDIGFQSAIYEVRSGGGLREVVVAFRGTDEIGDVRGNLSDLQNDYGLVVFDSVRAAINRREGRTVPIVVTGHSLGGGISLHISLRADSVRAYVFNASPRFSRGPMKDNPRVSIEESGEILKALQTLTFNTTQRYTKIGCRRGNPFANHGIRQLAECVTQIAAIDDAGARADLARNGIDRRFWRDGRPTEADAGVTDR